MSSTNRGAARVAQDKYTTPDYTVNSLLNVLDHSIVNRYGFLEPCRGDGAIYNRVDAGWKQYAEIEEGLDYFDNLFNNVDIVITNPPFSRALEFLEKSLEEAVTVIYLLRLNFLGSQKRKQFWQENPPTHLLSLSKRPSFVDVCKGGGKPMGTGCGAFYAPKEGVKTCVNCGGRVSAGTDSIEYGWFCWDGLGIVTLDPGIHAL